jgi:hypothetical protein
MPLHPDAVNLVNRHSAAGIRGVEDLHLGRARRLIEDSHSSPATAPDLTM